MTHQSLPRIAEPAVRPRELEILDQIRGIFAEKGFDGASMQELARAAGMSVGNFYRYFPSKAAMVEAMITRDLAEVEEKFACIAAAEDPLQALRSGLHARIAEGCSASDDDSAIWAEVTAAARRKPEIAAVVERMEREICGYLCGAFALVVGISRDEAERRFMSHARLAVALVKASTVQTGCREAVADPVQTALMQRMIDLILEEVCQAKADTKDRG